MHQSAIIIDDSPLERFIAERVIKNAQFAAEMRSFNSVTDALAFLGPLSKGQFPDVIFVDIQMPVLTGFDFLDKYLEMPETQRGDCKIIMLSSSLSDEDFARMKKYPIISKFLPKPLTEDLIRGIPMVS